MWFKSKKQKERVIAIHKVTVRDIVQYIVKVDGVHVTDGCCKTEEEANNVAIRYLSSDYGGYKQELIKEYTIAL